MIGIKNKSRHLGVTATAVFGALLSLATASYAAWTGPSFKEFSGVNQASPGDGLFTSAIGWNRKDVSWGDYEPTQGNYQTSYLNSVDADVSALQSQNVTFLPCLSYTANWAADTSARTWTNNNDKWTVTPNGNGTYTFNKYNLQSGTWVLVQTWQDNGSDKSKWPPALVSNWTNFVTRIVTNLHAAPYNLQYFQIWNEASNYSGFWTGSMADYINKVHLPAAAAIHAAGGKVVYGGWPSVESPQNLINLLDTYNAWSSIDVLDVHYFNPSDMATLRQAADSRGYPNIAIWMTENGFTTDQSFIANKYPRTLYWALNSNWSQPDKYKLFYFADWAPDDPAAYGYHDCLWTGSTLNYHGTILQNMANLLGTGHISAYSGITTVPALNQANDINYTTSSLEAFNSGQNIVVAVHLTATDYNNNSSITLTLPISKSLVTAAKRVDLSGTSVTLTSSLTGTSSTSLSVSTHDATGSLAKQWNEATSNPRTFYVVFTWSPIANGVYQFIPGCATGERLDADSFGTANGTKVQLWSNSGAQNQRWTLTRQSNGQYKIQPAYSSSVTLDVTGASYLDGTAMEIYTDNTSAAQYWYISPASTAGYYTLMPVCAGGSCLDVTGAGTANGTIVEIYHANGTTAQQWQITP